MSDLLIERVRRQKRRLERAEATAHTRLASERAELRRLIDLALNERYRKADLARALSISPQRLSALLKKEEHHANH